MMIAKKPRFQVFRPNQLDNMMMSSRVTATLGLLLGPNYANNINNCYNQEIAGDYQVGKRSTNNNGMMKTKMVFGSLYFPKGSPDRRSEDAHFICEEEQTIGVADGVGGWAMRGVDAGEYARELMNNSRMLVHNFYNNKTSQRKRKGTDVIGAIDPRKVLNEAYANTKKKVGLQGSSTACIVSLDKESGKLNGVNVGDSGLMVFRNNKKVYKSRTQQHRFNLPYQLGNHINSDCPESAGPIEFQTIPGDIVVLGTDGLFDNMFENEIEEVLGNYVHDCEVLASAIANLALYNSFNKYDDGPFSKEAKKVRIQHNGGKIDDITVIVGRVMASY